ncbi:Demethylmenaquinone methyltransferase [Seminavis robusta]|uniref:Demethylmenaquinone methyltransferase n=1 Tax=Seminavis robusta TaxID=568900 RepID=A0A9N8HEW9_9STRA|nr:Demethylmenaquinone methyltransferase [Seminavis robusta]|eukprot:Sro405_g136140.1 Demethylmenaquinone methyltransferase (227) ;mRNA; f:34080-34760
MSSTNPINDDNQQTAASPSALAGMTSNVDECRQVYNAWAQNYQKDVEQWGYQMPTQVATLLARHMNASCPKILDAGAGDGLSGVALRASFPECHLIGADLSPDMLQVARQRGCYDHLHELDLNQTPFMVDLSEDGSYDAIACVGTMTYVDPTKGTLAEFCRLVKPGGYICYTNRTDKLEPFQSVEHQLLVQRVWKLVEQQGPMPYLPNHPDFGDNIQVVIFLYQKL